MKKLSIKQLSNYLEKLIDHKIYSSLMLWGAPGIGKSSLVAQVAKSMDLELIDVRISQLAPTDLRGLPVVSDDRSSWVPPEFLPKGGKGILFLDEINMAPPAIQGIAQQLILDRKVGNYVLPDDWFIWGAGNRKEDSASVFDMPAPLANRFMHIEVISKFEEFIEYAIKEGFNETIISFLKFRPNLLHKIDQNSPAWPSPRSWNIANTLLSAGLDIDPAVGSACNAEFNSFAKVYKNLPPITPILKGKSQPSFPEDLSARYALSSALTLRAKTIVEVENVLIYLAKNANTEWLTQTVYDFVNIMQNEEGGVGLLADVISANPELMHIAKHVNKLMAA